MAYEPESKETRALTTIDSKRYPDTNKDFVKNLRRLNNDVDYMAGYMRIMQKGIDDANENFIEQIQSFINDIIVLFAGGEPTGIELGDLKYILQALGALFGFGDGPFPISLINAASHFFFGYVAPLEQFTDLIFNTIFAWAAELGLSEDFIEALRNLKEAIEELGGDLTEFLVAIVNLFDIFGIIDENGGISLDALAPLWDLIATFFDALNVAALKPILSVISTWGVPFVTALTNVIEVLDKILDALTDAGFDFEGVDGFDWNPVVFIQTIVSTFIGNGLLGIGSPLDAGNLFGKLLPGLFSKIPYNVLTGEKANLLVQGDFATLSAIYDNPVFTLDSTKTKSVDGTGSAKRILNGTTKSMLSIVVPMESGAEPTFSASFFWEDLVWSGSPFHLDVRTYSGDPGGDPEDLVEVDTFRIGSVTPGAADAPGWFTIEEEFDPENLTEEVTCIRVRLVTEGLATSGIVWIDDVSVTLNNQIQQEWVSGLVQRFLSIFGIFGTGQDLAGMQAFFAQFLNFLNVGDADGFVASTWTALWTNIANGRLNPLGFFANLIDGILPDSQKPAWLKNLTDGLGNLFFGSANENLGISNALESITGIWGVGNSAQSSANDANIGVQVIQARLDAPGVVGYDEFDYASANTLPGGSYSLYSEGPGSGNYGPNGKGQVVWKPSGASRRQKIYKRTDVPLSTDNGVVTAVWSTDIDSPLFSDGWGYLCARIATGDNTTRIQAAINHNSVRVQALNAGTVTNIGSSASVDTENGDVWQFWFGILTNSYKMWVKQNNVTVLSVEDTGHVSQLGSGHRMCGFGGQADNRAVIFQIAPPTLNGWTWKDQNLTAVA